MRRLGLRGVMTTALAALVISLACAAASASTTVWPSAAALGLPAGATSAASLGSVSCGSSSQCVAVGAYNGAGGTAPMAFTATNGAWSAATPIALPSGASSGELASVSCTGAGSCIAVGDADGGAHPLTASESAGAWTAAALSAGGKLSGIFCLAGGNCTAVGDSGGNAIAVNVAGGTFGQPATVALPSGAQSGTLLAVSCTTPGNCVAVGHYLDAGGQTQAMVATETAANWGQAAAVALPAGAAAGQDATLNAIDCPSIGHCTAVGSYLNGAGQATAMLATQSQTGAWDQAVPLALPAGATASGLDSISCNSSASCTATGYVVAASAAPLSATETGGSWSAGTALAIPAGAVPSSSTAITLAVGCTAAERCDAAGTYSTASGTGAMALDSHPSLSITSHALPAGAVGSRYSARIATSGGTGGNVWTFTGGSLPAGLTFNPATGRVSGTPTTDQTTTFSVSVSDNASPPDQASGTLSIRIGPRTKPPKTTTSKQGSSGKGHHQKHSKKQRGAKVGSVKVVHGSSVRFTIKCLVQRHCNGRAAVVVVEHLRGKKVIAINATTHRARGTRTRTIWLGSVRYALRGGHKVTRTIHLNRTGTRLLKAHHKLRAGLALRPASFRRATIEHTLKLHEPKAKHHKQHTKHGAHKKQKGAHSG